MSRSPWYCDEQISKAVLGQTLTSDFLGAEVSPSPKTHNEVRHDLTVAELQGPSCHIAPGSNSTTCLL
ncbi:DUF935 domain-containing protein [Paenibacillus melissococcoides]|uniref:DUF935 domain-containing protein n=1 Tax=Paenibacillus melissococcoides TaxID=2912268 RepID=UPI0021C3AAF9|nr:DUF935 domain-containing protein [Paenibacillus melissococcoides]